ncbi:exodeoxyribonuclease 7 large subunit [Fulvitalea axinellae]|uniref:Exodeoxyribonuclease 7 large subunit n=1 Tax=Fulvitalea axinellae TaxID=1182444 RepID=A0AAU9CAF9_9BACT|nr:exodeoxyribonuclease 7 large subunit [Fulvitalea axinellae]
MAKQSNGKQISLSALCATVKSIIEKNSEKNYWVLAEIGEIRVNPNSGHCYMELVEKENDRFKAKIRANAWAYTYRNINGWFQSITGSPLSQGMKVLANVSVNFHELYGISLTVNDIDPNYTLGERERSKRETIERLRNEGILDLNKGVDLPPVIQRIALITSSTAAGYGDFMSHIEAALSYSFDITLFQASMQGDKAEPEIIQALYDIYKNETDFDAVVLIRGGGAQTDLECFDNYNLAAHLAQFPLPVLTGIGHERDETICDLVANTKLKTPTATADFLIRKAMEFESAIEQLYAQVAQTAITFTRYENEKLSLLGQRMESAPKSILTTQGNQINNLALRIGKASVSALRNGAHQSEVLFGKAKEASRRRLEAENSKLSIFKKTVDLLNPERLFKRGYTVSLFEGKSLHKAGKIPEGSQITTIGHDFKATSTVTKFETKNTEQKKI